MGLINLLGLGQDSDINTALKHFEISKNKSDSLNALGYIYFKAPDYFETDPVEIRKYGNVKKDMKKAKEYLSKAIKQGSLNALYNMGCYYLSGYGNLTFSFTEAYDYFKQAAE